MLVIIGGKLPIGNGFGFSDGASWLCRSEDFGSTWEVRNREDYSQWQGWFAHDVAVHPERPDEITAIGIEVWRSDNGGSSLNRVSDGGVGFVTPDINGPDGNDTYVHSDAHDVKYQPGTNNIFVASDGGIHVSEDGGNTWRSRNARLQTTQFYNGFSVSSQDSSFSIGGLQDNGTIADNGDFTWSRINGGDGSWTAINPLDDGLFFVSSQFLNVVRIDQGSGNRPNIPRTDPTSFIAPFVIAADGQSMYAGSSNLAYSLDGGITWTPTFDTDGNPILSMEVSTQNPEKVYFATAPTVLDRGSVFLVDFGLLGLVDITQDLPDRFPMDMTVDPTNDDITWTDISTDLPDVPTNAVIVDPLIPNHIYVGNDLGVFFSPDGGVSWEAWQDGLMEAIMVFDLKISPVNRKIKAATHGNGAFERDLEENVVSTNETILALSDASIYPNPLQETGTIKFNLSEKTELDIRVFDLSGKEVKSIFKGARAEGQHQIEIEANGIAKGFYFIKMNSDKGQLAMKFEKI